MYFLAPPNVCTRKVGLGKITMTAKHCHEARGQVESHPLNPQAINDTDWVGCFLDWCTDGSFMLASPGRCLNVVAPLSMFTMKAGSCHAMGGSMESGHGENDTITCHLDLCGKAAELDSFDHLSLMMYSCRDDITPFERTDASKDLASGMISGEFFQYQARTKRECVDSLPKDTGFDVWGSDGVWMSYAACGDLKQYCHNQTYGARIQR